MEEPEDYSEGYSVVAAKDSPLVRFLFPAPAARRTGSIIAWWEKRRLAYNVIVGGGGLITLSIAEIGSLVLGEGLFSPLAPIIQIGILANICYTLGPIAEVAANKLFDRRLLPIGPTLFRNGLVFSLGLTLVLPIIMMTLGLIFRLLSGVF